jgi:hypothetical protein
MSLTNSQYLLALAGSQSAFSLNGLALASTSTAGQPLPTFSDLVTDVIKAVKIGDVDGDGVNDSTLTAITSLNERVGTASAPGGFATTVNNTALLSGSSGTLFSQTEKISSALRALDDQLGDLRPITSSAVPAKTLRAVITDHASTLGTHTTKITGLETLTTTQGSSIASLNTLTTTQGSSIASLNTLTGTAASLSTLSLGDNVVAALSSLKSANNTQDSSIGALQTTSTAHASSITALQTTTATQGTSIGALQTTTATQGTSITALNTLTGTADSLSTLSLGDNVVAALSSLKSVDGVQDSSIGALQTLTGTHTTKITGLETLTGTQGSSITALQTLTGTQGTSIASLNTLTATQGTSIASLNTLTATQGTSIAALNTLTATQGDSITALETLTGTQGDSITALETLTGTQGTSITALETLTDTHTDNISSLQSNGGGPSGLWSFGYDNMIFSADSDGIWDLASLALEPYDIPMPRFYTTVFRQAADTSLAVLARPTGLPAGDSVNLTGSTRIVKIDELPQIATAAQTALGRVGDTIGSCIRASRTGIFEVSFSAQVRATVSNTNGELGYVVAHMLLVPASLAPANTYEFNTGEFLNSLSPVSGFGVPRGAIAYTVIRPSTEYTSSLSTTFMVQLDVGDVLIPPRFSFIPVGYDRISVRALWDSAGVYVNPDPGQLYSDGSFAVNRCTCSIEWKGDGAVAPAEPVDPPV